MSLEDIKASVLTHPPQGLQLITHRRHRAWVSPINARLLWSGTRKQAPIRPSFLRSHNPTHIHASCRECRRGLHARRPLHRTLPRRTLRTPPGGRSAAAAADAPPPRRRGAATQRHRVARHAHPVRAERRRTARAVPAASHERDIEACRGDERERERRDQQRGRYRAR